MALQVTNVLLGLNFEAHSLTDGLHFIAGLLPLPLFALYESNLACFGSLSETHSSHLLDYGEHFSINFNHLFLLLQLISHALLLQIVQDSRKVAFIQCVNDI